MTSTDAIPEVTADNWRDLMSSYRPDVPLWRLALLTEKSPGSIYAYARGARPPAEWLNRIGAILRDAPVYAAVRGAIR